MTTIACRSFTLFAALGISAASLSHARVAFAEGNDREAAPHFQRAVQLYSEADYRAALVEFKRAYELSPNTTVLYNLGETYYQLQNYAQALDCFEKFLAEGGTAHRKDVESAIGVLKSRVGKVDAHTTTPGWEIAVDDEVIGTTPLGHPFSVSIGRRKIVATAPGYPPQTRMVEVAAGEVVPVSFSANGQMVVPPARRDEERGKGAPEGLLVAGWIGTGILGAGAVVTGVLAASEASDLKSARNTFPGNKSDIDSKASTTTTLSVLSDVLGASTLILGGVTLYFQLTRPSRASSTSARLGVSGQKLLLEGSF